MIDELQESNRRLAEQMVAHQKKTVNEEQPQQDLDEHRGARVSPDQVYMCCNCYSHHPVEYTCTRNIYRPEGY